MKYKEGDWVVRIADKFHGMHIGDIAMVVEVKAYDCLHLSKYCETADVCHDAKKFRLASLEEIRKAGGVVLNKLTLNFLIL